MNRYKKIYTTLFTCSLLLFLVSTLIQSPLIFSYSDSYGILFKMNWIFWLGYATLLILIYFQFRYFEKIDEKFVYLILLLQVIYLIGTPFFQEHLARFEDTWTHSYLVQEIFESGKVRNDIDIYENYPGAFLFFGVLFQDFPYHAMKFFPPLFYFVEIIVVYLLFKVLFNPRISFLSSTFYMFFNWTVEDNHISPQFLILFIFFLFLYVTVKFLRNWKKEKHSSVRKGLLLTTLFGFAIVFSHPGTPIFLLLILISVYILCKKFRKILLPLILINISIFLIYNFYLGTFNGYVDLLRNFFSLLYSGRSYSNISQRFVSNILSRNIFIASRLIITTFSVIVGLVGILSLYLKKDSLGAKFFLAWSFCMLVFSFFVGVVLKGEYYERFVLISSLPLAGLAAYFLSEFKYSKIILMILLIISPLYFIAKYGNEALESISAEKLQADCFDHSFYSDCEDRQEIVNTLLNFDLSELGERYFAVTREDVIASMIFLEKNKTEVENTIRNIEYNKTLDRVYSTYSSTVFR